MTFTVTHFNNKSKTTVVCTVFSLRQICCASQIRAQFFVHNFASLKALVNVLYLHKRRMYAHPSTVRCKACDEHERTHNYLMMYESPVTIHSRFILYVLIYWTVAEGIIVDAKYIHVNCTYTSTRAACCEFLRMISFSLTFLSDWEDRTKVRHLQINTKYGNVHAEICLT